MRAERAVGTVASEPERGDAPASRVRLPPLWLFGALAAVILMMVATKETSDILEYHCYALDFWQGAHVANAALAFAHHPTPCTEKIPDLAQSPFQELPREYGPLSLVVFSLPLLAPLGWYNAVFYALMCSVILGVAWLLDRHGPRGSGHIWLLYTLLGAMLEAAGRFDALPAAAVLIALLAAQRGRSLLAYGALAVGALLKFFPLALLPLLLILSWRKRRDEPFWRGPALFAGIMLTGEAIAALISPARALQPLGFMGARCVEVEAIPATLAYLWGGLIGVRGTVASVQQYSSVCQFTPGLDTAAQLIVALPAGVGLLAVYWLYKRGRLSLTHGFIFTIGLAIMGVKVFSVQYLLWLSPLIAYAYGTQLLALAGWGAICLVTTLYYPVVDYFGRLVVNQLPFLVAVRNTLLVIVGGLALRGALRRSRDAEGSGAQSALGSGRQK